MKNQEHIFRERRPGAFFCLNCTQCRLRATELTRYDDGKGGVDNGANPGREGVPLAFCTPWDGVASNP